MLICIKNVFGSDVPKSYTQIFQTFEHIFLKILGPIYSHRVPMREGGRGIFPDHTFRGVVKISLNKWTKTYTYRNGNDMKNAGHIFLHKVSQFANNFTNSKESQRYF